MTAQAGGRSKRVCRIILHARGGGVEGKESDVVVQILHHLPDLTWYYGTLPPPLVFGVKFLRNQFGFLGGVSI